ncbi:MAG: class I SAM-dependent RNA methyltransferase [Pyrinomonadaceae bacterium]
MSKNYSPGDVLDVKIEKILPRGVGLAFAEKLTLFVPLAAPGDRLRVRIEDIRKRTAFAEIVDIIEPSPRRTEPPCPHFSVCGGCDFQQMDYGAQLSAKTGIIRDCLHRITKIDDAKVEMIGSPEQFGYRSRARWHLDREARKVGYFRSDSHDLVDVDKCPILTREMQSAMETLKSEIDWKSLFDDRGEIDVVAGDDGRVSMFSREMIGQVDEISAEAGGERYAFSAKSFFQANRSLVGSLVETAIGGASGETALDLYCGVGLFSVPLARKFTNVIGVEDSDIAVEFARKNSQIAKLTNLDIRRSSVRRFLNSTDLAGTDLILIDPPRIGAEKGVIEKIAEIGPRAISYVSCEPSILARDLRILLDAAYTIDSITALDMFPQTHHVETVARLSAAVVETE